MAIYEILSDKFVQVEATSFPDVRVKERQDLQRLLKNQIDIVSPDTLVISEEFCDWENSNRRIDLLAVDKDANLVVIELKNTDSGGHMELQAIRYAAMISAMTFEKAVEIYDVYLQKNSRKSNAQESLFEFLEWEEPNEVEFAKKVRIVLVSADFSKEITTSVMWLNSRSLDIRCVRMKPYRYCNKTLVDVQQVIPLPEAADFMVKIREKAERNRIDEVEQHHRYDLRLQFWTSLLERARSKTELFTNISPCKDGWIMAGSGVRSIHYKYTIRRSNADIQLILEGEKEKNKLNYDFLFQRREEIENVFGESLEWKRCDEIKQSSIIKLIENGGYCNDRVEWPGIQDAMIDAMIRLEKAVSQFVRQLKV